MNNSTTNMALGACPNCGNAWEDCDRRPGCPKGPRIRSSIMAFGAAWLLLAAVLCAYPMDAQAQEITTTAGAVDIYNIGDFHEKVAWAHCESGDVFRMSEGLLWLNTAGNVIALVVYNLMNSVGEYRYRGEVLPNVLFAATAIASGAMAYQYHQAADTAKAVCGVRDAAAIPRGIPAKNPWKSPRNPERFKKAKKS